MVKFHDFSSMHDYYGLQFFFSLQISEVLLYLEDTFTHNGDNKSCMSCFKVELIGQNLWENKAGFYRIAGIFRGYNVRSFRGLGMNREH